jgi:hypothetical protein
MSETLKTYPPFSPQSDIPAGVRFSAVIMVLFAFGSGLCGLFCLIAVVMLLVNHGSFGTGIALGIGGILVLGACLVCLRAASALRSGLTWGANLAVAVGGFAIALGGTVLFDLFHSRGHIADEYFVYPVAPALLLLGVWLCVYLNIPSVRLRFDKRSD